MPRNTEVRAAMANGRVQADRMLKARKATLARRRKAAGPRARAARVRGPDRPTQVLLAEGDSWFDYPFCDVIKELEDGFAYEVENIAHKGDAIEEMAYGGGQLDELIRRLERLLSHGRVPKAVLLSGGGNDVAGDEFGMLLNHAASSIAGLNAKVLDGVVNERVKMAYAHIIESITEVCRQMLGAPIPILVHGYDYPVPDGRGFLGGWAFLPGPWLEPGFRQKGFAELSDRKRLARALIDNMNLMLVDLCGLQQFGHVRHIDLRNSLSSGADYEEWWDNELHPTPEGFQRVAVRFHDVLRTLP